MSDWRRPAMIKADRAKVERMYQRAMNLRDQTMPTILSQSRVPWDPIEDEYTRQYLRAYREGDVRRQFRQQTREYRALVRAYSVCARGPIVLDGAKEAPVHESNSKEDRQR